MHEGRRQVAPHQGTLSGHAETPCEFLGKPGARAEIAGRLHLGETTVKTHVGRVLAKLQVRDRIGAVIFAYETGLSRPGT